MCLSKEAASDIVSAVKKDADCNAKINSRLKRRPASWGASGWTRNVAYGVYLSVTLDDYVYSASGTNPAFESLLCTGIASCTERAIAGALERPGIPEVKSVGKVDRFDPPHTATLITMKEGSEYVFDWHATLNPRNPLIYRAADWQAKRRAYAQEAVAFTGFACKKALESKSFPCTPRLNNKSFPGTPRYHQVVAGDWLSKIAIAFYGDVDLWPIIYDANMRTIGSDPDRIEPGQVLLIPERTFLTGGQVAHARQRAREWKPSRQ